MFSLKYHNLWAMAISSFYALIVETPLFISHVDDRSVHTKGFVDNRGEASAI